MLTTEACNALLKTLEEPPAHVVFILATTEPQKILPTIHSRCQRFDFHPLTQEEIVDHLRKVAAGSDIKADDEALQLIAAASEGGMRDALSLLEQCGVMAEQVTGETVRSVRGIVGREILRQLMAAVGQSQPAAALEIFAKLLEQGKDIAQILLEIEEYLRSLLLFQAAPDYQQIYVTDTAAAFKQLVSFFPPERILAAQEVLHQALGELRFLSRGRIVAEMCLCDLCQVKGDSLLALKARVAQLEKAVAGGVTLPYTAPQVVAPQVTTEPKVATPKVVAAPKVVAPQVTTEPKVVAPKVAAAPKVVTPKVVAAPKVATPKVAAAPKVVAPQVAAEPKVVAPQPVQPYSGDWATGDAYWTQARELLKGEGKMSMFACALTASVLSLEGDVLTLGFKNKFTCDRMQQPDYRASFEDALLRVSRRTIKLSCVLETAKPAAPKKKVTAKTEAVPEAAMGTSARKAMAFFGGTLQWAAGKQPEPK